ncbi:MAG TPA: adenosylmethionine decarboxylase [Deltaproteobacteria bacterium]|nr:adenosylmethionine decarboxylase [Deltaproteobacteria bacterium]
MKPVGMQIVAEFHNCSKDILNDLQAIEKILIDGISECGFSLVGINSHRYEPIGVTSIAVISESHVAIHTYPEAHHASIDIFTCSRDKESTNNLLEYFKKKLDPTTTRTAEIIRGNPIEVTETNWITDVSDTIGFDIRYHFKTKLLSTSSEYQQIDIIDNEIFGRMLFLNSDLQIAEYDAHLYNKSLVAPLATASIPMKRIAILGGGDGGVLNEMLKQNPDSVVLVDIDKVVVESSKEYLRCICRDAFDDHRVEIVYDDVKNFLETEHRFDGIIYDLTMHPETFINMDREEYLESLFSGIESCLNPGGMVTCQCCSEYDKDTYDMSSRILKKFFSHVAFSTTNIPSFCTPWVFATAQK